ncbi:bifunctional metallophosphatase/5'-nucleotidase [Pseudoduganella aquatica]|uniref:Bifunctional metallophosphatase/5'-nucleotidase n=1 Tax=Pseudoduganella aquatica TaxID=2660641 RepID=A0A7X4KMK0_9BURK|nr:bifunctional metallophosphatase/5'-nucleotidase [Pseudoduganella aquatica]MYN08262.1 bifunctional metallophosphatase/5'-nucleotidase [Pseudoduganella aquatica]
MNHPFKSSAPALVLALAALLAGCASQRPATVVDINIATLNDFHGNILPSKFSYTNSWGFERSELAGGIDTIAAALQAWRAEDRELLLVGAGDLIGASPAISSMWADETTLGALNLLGLQATSVGNHEFDAGRAELLRQQKGGCVSPRPDKACKFEPVYPGAKFQYLAANVVDMVTNKPFLPAYSVQEAHGVKVGFIGAVLKDTAQVVLASGIAGLQFGDEAQAINRALPELRAQGVNVFVALIHQGGRTTDALDQPDCPNLKGEIVDLVKRLDPAIKVVISGHSHKGYLCRVDGRLVTQAETAGHVMSRIRLSVDTASNTVLETSARNVVMKQDQYPADPAMAAYMASVRQRSDEVLGKPVARLAVAKVARATGDDSSESAIGDLVADSMLAAGKPFGAQIAFMNRGGLRQDLLTSQGNNATLAHLHAVLPFGNTLDVMNLTGAQIRALLEEQWLQGRSVSRGLLQVSDGFTYQWDASQPEGQRLVPGSVLLHGVRIEDGASYRVVTNHFLAEGGDYFPTFARGASRAPTPIRDIDALAAYLAQRDRDGKPAGSEQQAGRIQRIK